MERLHDIVGRRGFLWVDQPLRDDAGGDSQHQRADGAFRFHIGIRFGEIVAKPDSRVFLAGRYDRDEVGHAEGGGGVLEAGSRQLAVARHSSGEVAPVPFETLAIVGNRCRRLTTELVAPLPKHVDDRLGHQRVFGAEMIADRGEIGARGGDDVARGGVGITLLAEALFGAGEQIFLVSHDPFLAAATSRFYTIV